MRGVFSKYLSDESWLIYEHGFSNYEELRVKESLFTLGNGYIGSRGIYEEIPDGTEPGTYIAGVFDRAGAMVSELVNVPNPIDFRIVVEGEKLDIKRMDVLEHERILNLQKGLLLRKTIFMDTKKRKFLYQSIRFFSMADPHIGCMQVYFTPLDRQANIIVQDAIDDSVTNVGGPLEGRKRHTQVVDVSTLRDMNYLCVKTFTKKIRIGYTSFLAVSRGKGEGVGTLNKIFNMSLRKNETASFTKIFSIYTSRYISYKKLKSIAVKETRRAIGMGFDLLLERHIKNWEMKWNDADIKIKSNDNVQKALRFNIYHLIISGASKDEDVSIGARTLSGSGYRGHIFWDTEIFILPFFIYTNPRVARNLLMYRYNRLSKAKEIAKTKGYRGALFPWESADSGEETTPSYAKGLDGRIIEIHTMDMEHHIVADIAYAMLNYFTATYDIEFMLKAGLELLFETARFWASRVEFNKIIKKYEIKDVIGPDEFHEHVNNNAYTNKMAQWNLQQAVIFFYHFLKVRKHHLKKMMKKLNLSIDEVLQWERIANKIYIPYSKNRKIIEEFDGYLRKRKVVLGDYNRYFMPVLSTDIFSKDIGKNQLVKQADVVMLFHLIPEGFSKDDIRRNYLFYVTRTIHKSSLSSSIYSIAAAKSGDPIRAYIFFLFSLFSDLDNLHGNTGEGIHAANLGGVWQAVLMGFCGFSVTGGMPSFEPHLPGHWRGVEFTIMWRGLRLKVNITKKRIKFFVFSPKKDGKLLIKYSDSVYAIPYNKNYVIGKG